MRARAISAAALWVTVVALVIMAGAATAAPKPGDPPDTSSSPTAAGAAWWTLPVTGLVGAVLGAAGWRALSGRRDVQAGRAGPDPMPPPPDDQADLIRAVIGARDLAEPSSALAGRLGVALARAGVAEVTPVGTPFDPTRHRAVGTVVAPDRRSADLVAEVQRVGYAQGNTIIRVADVVVFRPEPVA